SSYQSPPPPYLRRAISNARSPGAASCARTGAAASAAATTVAARTSTSAGRWAAALVSGARPDRDAARPGRGRRIMRGSLEANHLVRLRTRADRDHAPTPAGRVHERRGRGDGRHRGRMHAGRHLDRAERVQRIAGVATRAEADVAAAEADHTSLGVERAHAY